MPLTDLGGQLRAVRDAIDVHTVADVVARVRVGDPLGWSKKIADVHVARVALCKEKVFKSHQRGRRLSWQETPFSQR